MDLVRGGVGYTVSWGIWSGWKEEGLRAEEVVGSPLSDPHPLQFRAREGDRKDQPQGPRGARSGQGRGGEGGPDDSK